MSIWRTRVAIVASRFYRIANEVIATALLAARDGPDIEALVWQAAGLVGKDLSH
jgi:hypothetical protein